MSQDYCTAHSRFLYLIQKENFCCNSGQKTNTTRPGFGRIPVAAIRVTVKLTWKQQREDCRKKWDLNVNWKKNSILSTKQNWVMPFLNMSWTMSSPGLMMVK